MNNIFLFSIITMIFLSACTSSSYTYQNPPKNGVLKATRGSLYEEIPFKNGKRNGTQKTYIQKSKKLIDQSTYVNGKLDGTRKRWFYDKQGKLESHKIIHFKNGKLHGSSMHYDGNGNLRYSEYYVNGKKDGTQKYYFNNGKPQSIHIYKNGHPLKETYYYKNGKIERKIIYTYKQNNNKKTKYWETFEYDKDGKFDDSFTKSVTRVYNKYGNVIELISGPIKFSRKFQKRLRQEEIADRKWEKEYARQQKLYRKKSSLHTVSSNGRTRITQNDGKFIGGVCADGSSFFVEVKGELFEGSGTNGVCTKASLPSTISCVCSGG